MEESFDGLGNLNGLSPGDPTGAGGDSHVVVAVNTSVAVYSRMGVLEAGPFNLEDTVPGSLSFVFDPKVVYNQFTDQFVLVFLGINDRFSPSVSRIYVVSMPDATAATPATWCAREVDGDQQSGDGMQWADYPGVGYDQDRVYVATNQFGSVSGWFGAQIIALDNAGLTNCASPFTYEAFSTQETLLKDGRRSQSLQPATTDGLTPSPAYVLGFDARCPRGRCEGDRFELFSITDTGPSLALKSKYIDAKHVEMASGTQKGFRLSDADSRWDTGDIRITNAFYDADRNELYAAHSIAKDLNKGDGYVEAVAKWYEFTPGTPLNSSVLNRFGRVGQAKKDAGWPWVVTDSDGVLYVNYARASGVKGAKEFLGAWVANVQPATKAPSGSIIYGAGTGPYDPYFGPERWGDYAGGNRDPVTAGRVWLVNMTATSNPDDFQQVVAQVFDL